jgi:hypothetical protein
MGCTGLYFFRLITMPSAAAACRRASPVAHHHGAANAKEARQPGACDFCIGVHAPSLTWPVSRRGRKPTGEVERGRRGREGDGGLPATACRPLEQTETQHDGP